MAQAFGARIAAIARKEAKYPPGKACGPNKAGTTGYFHSCNGNNGRPEYWCADFARWVWWKAGAVNTAPGTHTLNALAASFVNYGPVRRRNPKVGDAVLFHDEYGKIHHVAIVVRVRPDGRIASIGGDEGGTGHGEAAYARTAYVKRDGPYDSAYGSLAESIGMHISGYVSPVEDDMPYSRAKIVEMVQDGVAAELKAARTRRKILRMVQEGVEAELTARIGSPQAATAAQGAQAAVDTKATLAGIADRLDRLMQILDPTGTGTATGTETTAGTAPRRGRTSG